MNKNIDRRESDRDRHRSDGHSSRRSDERLYDDRDRKHGDRKSYSSHSKYSDDEDTRERHNKRYSEEGERKGEKSEKRKKHKKKSRSDDSEEEEDKAKLSAELAISEDDYFLKATEFKIWLKEEKGKYIDELSSDKSRSYFKKFVKDWNKGKLSKKYYDGIRPSQVASSDGTRYKWSFAKKMNQYELDSVRDSIDTATNVKFPTEVARRTGVDSSKMVAQPEKRVIGPSMPSKEQFKQYDEEMDEEDRARYERALRKKDQKRFSKSRDADLEELVPKATGREAMLEKKRAITAFHRREASPDVELPDSELMGGDDFQSRLAAEKRRNEGRNSRKQQIQAERAALNEDKLKAYQAKESATIEMFRQMAQHNQLMQHRPPQ